MSVKILQKESEVLRKIAKEVPKELIGSDRLNKIISDMKKALDSQDDGVAIAAPQIGVPLRMFVVSGKAISFIKDGDGSEKKYPDMVFINPEITKFSKKKEYMEEGCLSVRYLYGKVQRSSKVDLLALDESGNKIKRGASGLMAQIFQHETDHLNGVLFIDKAKDVEDIPPEVVADFYKKQKKSK